MVNFGSMFKVRWTADPPHKALFFYHLLAKGVYYPIETHTCFLSTAHTEADVNFIIRAYQEAVEAMQASGFFFERAEPAVTAVAPPQTPASTPALRNVSAVATSGATSTARRSDKTVQFSLYYFGDYPAEHAANKYDLLIEGVKLADQLGFTAVWLPERHFHSFGGISPNPATLAAALATITRNIHLRAGSCVLPLHHPIRAAEEWAVVDNLSKGRIGISFATGWHPNDFVFAPQNYENRHAICSEQIKTVLQLWRGEAVTVKGGAGNDLSVRLHPQPTRPELPMWISGNSPKTFEFAAGLGANVLTNLQEQTPEELTEKIKLYRATRARLGLDPKAGHVTVLLHAYLGENPGQAIEDARQPFYKYVKSGLKIMSGKIQSQGGQANVDATDEKDLQYLLKSGYQRYLDQDRALLGTVESVSRVVDKLIAAGVNEIGCLIDFGVEFNATMRGLTRLGELRRRYSGEPIEDVSSVANQLADEPRPAAPCALTGPRVPLTEGQRGLLFLCQMNPEATRTYNESVTLQLRGALNLPALRESIQALVDRHEALRTTFHAEEECQIVAPQLTLEIPLLDYSSIPATGREEKLRNCFLSCEKEVFDLAKGPLLSARIIKLEEQLHLLAFKIHHLVSDGHSYGILLQELKAFYGAKCQGTSSAVLPAPRQYRDYVEWQQTKLAGPDVARDEAYWLQRFQGPLPVLELPVDHPRPAVLTYHGGRATLTLDAGLTRDLRRAGAQQGCTLFMTMLAAYHAWLHRLTRQDDLIVAIASSPPDVAENLFGYCVNVLPIRSQLTANTSFAGFVKLIKKSVLEATDHQFFFFGRLLNKLNVPRDLSRSPLFSVVFNMDKAPGRQEFHGLEVTGRPFPARNPIDTTRFEVGMNVVDRGAELTAEVTFNTDLIEPATMQRWLRHFETLLRAVAAQPEQPVSALPLLTDTERQQILVEWNNTRREFPTDHCFHHLFEAQVTRTPDAPALKFENDTLTYRELNRRTNQLAHHLRALGVGPDVPVGICLDRSLDMLVALLGVLKAGGAYVPFDPNFPKDRMAFMLEDTQVPVVLIQEQLLGVLPPHKARVVCLDGTDPKLALPKNLPDTNPVSGVKPEHLVYLIYTSGSTGRPKGVALEHRQLVNYVLAVIERLEFSPGAQYAMVSTLAADLGNTVVYPALCTGGCLHVIPADLVLNPTELGDYFEQNGIDVLKIVPSHLAALRGDDSRVMPRRRLIVGGEASRGDWVRTLRSVAPDCVIFNHYGPTETTVGVLTYRVGANLPSTLSGTLPLGRPLPNTQVYVLDAARQPAPIGLPGELYIGGDGVARGYWPVPHPISKTRRGRRS